MEMRVYMNEYADLCIEEVSNAPDNAATKDGRTRGNPKQTHETCTP